MNLSCNFFKGRFDVPRYIDWVDRYWRHLQALEQRMGGVRGYNVPSGGSAGEGSASEGSEGRESGAGVGGGAGLGLGLGSDEVGGGDNADAGVRVKME